MLVPLEVYVLVQKLGRLTPSLVMGWRIGQYLREMFAGLDGIRLAVSVDDDVYQGLRLAVTESGFPLDVLLGDSSKAWDVAAWHPATGTRMDFTISHQKIAMDARGAAVACEARRGDMLAKAVHGMALDRQVVRLMKEPLETLCRIHEGSLLSSRYVEDLTEMLSCRRCGRKIFRKDVWRADGIPCCSTCAEVPDSWRMNH